MAVPTRNSGFSPMLSIERSESFNPYENGIYILQVNGSSRSHDRVVDVDNTDQPFTGLKQYTTCDVYALNTDTDTIWKEVVKRSTQAKTLDTIMYACMAITHAEKLQENLQGSLQARAS